MGLNLNAPEAAVVMCVDQKSQIQAFDCSAPALPLVAGVPERHAHDYIRNGTSNLYAALEAASGQIIADLTPRHRAEEFRRFLNLIEHESLTQVASRGASGRSRCETKARASLSRA